MKEDCRKYFERISEYLNGELDDEICREIETHLKECPECRECLDSLKKTIQLCKEAGKEAIPPDIRERLRSNLRELLDRNLK
jgi:RNA polymerase sigma-70 factor (ECF subfamily)